MNPQKIKLALLFFFGAIAGMFAMYLFSNYKIEKKNQTEVSQNSTSNNNRNQNNSSNSRNESTSSPTSGNINELTEERKVIDYVKANHRLPDYYITKSEARNQGWHASAGNLCEVLPGRAIGGDKFSNREKTLPKGNQYFEADVNYNCGKRNADRIVFTTNGDVWLTKNHYKSFDKQ